MAGLSGGVGSSVGTAILGVLSWVLLALGSILVVLYILRATGMQDVPTQWKDLAGGVASLIFGGLARLLSRRFAAM